MNSRGVPHCGEGYGDTLRGHFQVGLSLKKDLSAANSLAAVEPCLRHSATDKMWLDSPANAAPM